MALQRLMDIFNKGLEKNMLFVRYEDLCLHPTTTMTKIYEYLGLEYYQHDFDSIEQHTKEDDSVYGFEDLHSIRTKLEMKPSDARRILGDDPYFWIYNNIKWYFDYFNYKK